MGWMDGLNVWIGNHVGEAALICVVLIIIGIFLIAYIIDRLEWFFDPYRKQPVLAVMAEVVEKIHQLETSSTSTGIGVDSKGNPVTTVSSSSTPERFVLVMQIDGMTDTIDVDQDEYYSIKEGLFLKTRYKKHPKYDAIRVLGVTF